MGIEFTDEDRAYALDRARDRYLRERQSNSHEVARVFAKDEFTGALLNRVGIATEVGEMRNPDQADHWVVDLYNPLVQNLGGVDWLEAQAPPVQHSCTPQSRGILRDGAEVERCACGAIWLDGKTWTERNSKSKAVAPEHKVGRLRRLWSRLSPRST